MAESYKKEQIKKTSRMREALAYQETLGVAQTHQIFREKAGQKALWEGTKGAERLRMVLTASLWF